jgi:hypothetical protein
MHLFGAPHSWLPLTALVALMAQACDENLTTTETDPTEFNAKNDGEKLTELKGDQWTAVDAPTLFSPDVTLKLEALPMEGSAAAAPWAGSYWPVYEDSINYRWAGPNTDSPAAKFGKAFNVPDVERKVSEAHGILKQSHRKACKTNDDCDRKLRESCGKRIGEEEGRCIPTWFGICHAWAPAAVREPEPVHPVTINGVTFEVADIKALVTLAYDKPSSKFVSLRCDKNDDLNEIEYDAYGRPTDAHRECRDTNAGTYHVLLANYLGIRRESFVEDRQFDNEVWNHPLRSYRVTMMKEVTAREANVLVGVKAAPAKTDTAEHSQNALAKDAWFRLEGLTVVPGTTVTIAMTGTADADLYVRFGADPTTETSDCAPYHNHSNETCELVVPSGVTKLHVGVLGFAASSDIVVKTSVPREVTEVPTHYLFNRDAVRFFQVATEVRYISESDSAEDGNLAHAIDRYTRTDFYEYILEIDKNGNINGGEWLNGSKRNHPDFLWLPTGLRQATSAGGAISYARVKEILNASIAGPNAQPDLSFKTANESGRVEQGKWLHFGPFSAASDFTVGMTGTADGDLYVRRGAQPTTNAWDCRPYASGSDEHCDLPGAGEYYVSVYGFRASDINLAMSWRVGTTAPPAPTPSNHVDVSGQVERGKFHMVTLPVKAGQKIVIRTEAPLDVDLYIRMALAPTLSQYDARGYTSSGNESLTFTAPTSGLLNIGVYGYKASAFRLVTADPQ